MAKRRILYIQHASGLGGSCVSLLYTIQGLDRSRYEPIVALAQPADDVESLYVKAGIKVIRWPGIGVYNHVSSIPRQMYKPSTWWHLQQVARAWPGWEARTRALLDHVKPDLVHLNSVVLSASARAIASSSVPCVWHVREHTPKEHVPWRTGLLRKLMLRSKHALVFISHADQSAWVASDTGDVIHDFVDFHSYDKNISGSATRHQLGIAADAPVIIYAGGLTNFKGIFTLIATLKQLHQKFPNLRCIAPGSVYPAPTSRTLRLARYILPKVGSGTNLQLAERAIRDAGLQSVMVRLPFRRDMPRLIAASDVLLFPATVPHFARPIVEAAAMSKPAVASDLAGAQELIVDGVTGYLVKNGDADTMTHKVQNILSDKALQQRLGEAAYQRSTKLFTAEENCCRIEEIYDKLLKSPSPPSHPTHS